MKTKSQQLRFYKNIATGLFILMALVFIITTIYQKNHQEAHWVGYIRAFSEAAMVGALADWFAVTALFHHPLGLKIPHTNLIEKSKNKIGDNLGNFVVENFLSPQNIRPYIQKLSVSPILGQWLEKPTNQALLVDEISTILTKILQPLDDKQVVTLLSGKAKELSSDLKINQLLSGGIHYMMGANEHQKLLTYLSHQMKIYIEQNQNLVRERVKKESYALIPKFVDDAIADKITHGIAQYFDEIAQQNEHPIRQEVTQKLAQFSEELNTPAWEEKLNALKNEWLNEARIAEYVAAIWATTKANLMKELTTPDSTLRNYMAKNLMQFSSQFKNDENLKLKIDRWVRRTLYGYLLKNTHRFAELISQTVGNWEGKELSQKLELEVGKDLQFIRVNGTLVGGLVGLIIYALSHIFL
ncbi:DUF445 domain-containing protein [Riemerella columbina]|uniref:DUF445 domain-containing protein n=1 Tax=Riemerella columbina TaxID=103810 RepID=UPI00266F69E4|nr:DUF445 domain-containing protein [Riemerella columbina]WKS95256.1 DUF445 domain-containing protein [Riemerella columbina]